MSDRYIVYTDDGQKHYLSDNTTNENYFEEKEKFLSSYTPIKPEPKIEETQIETDFIDDEDIPKTKSKLKVSAQGALAAGLSLDAITNLENEEQSSLGLQTRGGFSRQYVQAPAQKDLERLAPNLADANTKLNYLLQIENPSTIIKDEIESLRKQIKGDKDYQSDEALKEVVEEYMNNPSSPLYNIETPSGIIDPFLSLSAIENESDRRQGLEKTVQDRIDTINKSQKFQDQIVYSDSFKRFAESEDAKEAFDIFLSDPFNLIGQVTATSLGPASVSLASGVAGTLIGGPVLGAVATGLASGSVDSGHSFTEYMVKAGMNPSDPNSVAEYMSDKKLVDKARKYALTRGAIIGAFDGVSFGLATKLLAPSAISNIFLRQAVNSLGFQPIIQGGLGGSGEYFAQLATLKEGEKIRVGDVAMEAVGEFGFAPIEATLAQISAGRKYTQEKHDKLANEQIKTSKEFKDTLRSRLTKAGVSPVDIEPIAQRYIRKVSLYREQGLDLLEAEAKAASDLDMEVEMLEAYKIYGAYTNDGQKPEQFPFKIVTPEATLPNVFLTKRNDDGTFTIVDYQGNPLGNPKTGETYAYKSEEKALRVKASLNFLSQTQYGLDRTQSYIDMQNLDPDNPFVSDFGLTFTNPYFDGITIDELEKIGVESNIIEDLKNATGNDYQVPIRVLKDNLNKKQFDKIMTMRSESGSFAETQTPKSITEATFKKLFKDKNVEFDANSDSFAQLAFQYTGETNINNMSIAQKKVLYSVISRLPKSPELIPLPDFSNRSYSLNDYNKALQAIIDSNKPTLKIIREATGLNSIEAKKLRQDLITSGYIEVKNNKYKFLGVGNKKFDSQGKLLNEEDIEVNKQLDNLIESFKNNLPPEVAIKFEKYIRDQQNNIEDRAGGSFNPIFNEITIAIDRAGENFKKNPKKFLDDLAVVLGHETFHALKQADLFTQAEYNTLENYARTKKPKGSNQTYYQIAFDKYKNDYDNDADIVEEGIASVFEDFIKNQQKPDLKTSTILNKVSNFFIRTANVFSENGFQTANDIVERSLSGKLANRETGVNRTNVELERVKTAFINLDEVGNNLGFDINNEDDAPVSVRPIEDAPSLKYKFREDLLTKPPRIYTEYIMGVEDGQFSEDMSAWTNLMYQSSNVLNEYLVKRRFPTADKNNLNEISQVAYNASQVLLRKEANNKSNGIKDFYFVGDIPTGDTVAIAYDNMGEAIKAARLGDSQYHSISGNPHQIRGIKLNFSDVLFHPDLINLRNNPTISNPYKNKGLFGVSKNAIVLKQAAVFPVKPVLPQSTTKYSLVRTEGRITPERELQLVTQLKDITNDNRPVPITWQSLRDKYDYYDREKQPLIDRVIRQAQEDGSDSIAAILENDENYFMDTLGLDGWSINTVKQLQEDINSITRETLSNFPEQIVVYRGGNIQDEYDVVPVTFNRTIAEQFSRKDVDDVIFGQSPQEDARQEVEEGIYEEDGSIIEYIIPKDKVLAYINPIMTGGYDFDRTGSLGKMYTFFNESELLVNKKDLIEAGRPIERLGPRFKQQLYHRIKTIKDQAQEILNDNSINFLMGAVGNPAGPEINTEIATDDVYNLLVRQLEAKLKKLSNKRLNRNELIKLLTDSALQEAELRVFNQEETAKNVNGKIESDLYFDEELKARENKYVPQLIRQAESYAKGTVNQDRKAVIAIGLPASGKSHFAEKIAKKIGAAIVDSDDAKKILPEFGNGLGANAVAVESSFLSKEVLEDQLSKGDNIVIPKVGGSNKVKSLDKLIYKLQDDYNYDVDIVLVDTDFNSAATRVLNRFVATGRYIPSSYLIDVENTPRDTYNYLKDNFEYRGTGFVFINNNFGVGEQTLEEDTTESYQYLAERRGVGVGNDELSIQQDQEQSRETKRLLQKAEAEKQKSIDAGVRPVINTGANPDAVAAAVKAQEDIKNTPSAESADINFILSDIGQNNSIKYSFKNSGKPLKPETERIVQRLTVRDNTPDNVTIGQKVLQSLDVINPFTLGKNIRREITDRYGYATTLDYQVGKNTDVGDKILSAGLSAAAALYHSDRAGDIFQQSFLRGVPVYDKEKGYTYVNAVSQIDGEAIVAPYEIFKEAINNPNMMWAFQAVLRVQRETRFNAEGRKVKITAQDKKDAQQALKDYPQLQTMIDQYQRWNSHVVQFLVDTGVIDQKTGDIWMQTSDYIPFYRPLEGMEGFKGPRIFQDLSITPFKRAKGSEEKDIVDPITGITNNLRAAITVGMKNVAANRVMRNLQMLEVADQVKNNVQGADIIKIKVDGKTTSWRVSDPDAFHIFSTMSESLPPMGFIKSLFMGAKTGVSELITRMPDFWYRQILRDSISAWGLSGANYVPVYSSIKEAISITKGMITGNLPPEFKQLRDAGVITGYDKGVRQIDSTEKLINNLYKSEQKKQRTTVEKVAMAPFDTIVKIWEILGQGTAITDAATRVAVMKDTLKRTGDEAEGVFQAMEVLNFTRRGSNPQFQVLAQTVMFLNPRLQGLDVFYRGLVKGEYGVGRKLSRRKRLMSAWIRMMSMASLVPYYYLLVRDTEEYKEAPAEIKNNYLFLPASKKLTGEVLAIPKPFEVGLLAFTIPELLTGYFMDDIAGDDVAEQLKRNLKHTFAITPPTLVEPFIENFANKDFFTGRPIVPDYLKSKKEIGKIGEDLGFRPQTDILSKKIGDKLDVSPLYIENIIRGYTGTMGSYVMTAFDSILREGLTGSERASLRLDQLPVIGAFILPPEGRGIENQFYELKNMSDDLVSSYSTILKNVVEKNDKYSYDMTSEYKIEYMELVKELSKALQKTADELSELRTLEAQIINNRTISGDEKRDQLLEISRIRNEILKSEQIPEIRKLFIEDILPEAVQR